MMGSRFRTRAPSALPARRAVVPRLFGATVVACAAASLVLAACSQPDARDAAAEPQAPQAASQPPDLAITIANNSPKSSTIYYYNSLITVKPAPGFTCNIASGPLTWETIVVPAALGATASTVQIPAAGSGIDVCISVGLPQASNPPNNTEPYTGPYLMQSQGSSVNLWQTWTLSPAASNFNHFLNTTLPSGSSTTWTAANDASGLSFTYTGLANKLIGVTVNLAGTATVKSITPNAGPASGGASVTITGSEFQPGAKPTIGGNPMTGVSVLSSSKMTGILPAGKLGAQSVQVTNPSGVYGVLVNGYTYVAPPGAPPGSNSRIRLQRPGGCDRGAGRWRTCRLLHRDAGSHFPGGSGQTPRGVSPEMELHGDPPKYRLHGERTSLRQCVQLCDHCH